MLLITRVPGADANRKMQLPSAPPPVEVARVPADLMKKYDLNPTTVAFLGLLLAFFGLFLFYPVGLRDLKAQVL